MIILLEPHGFSLIANSFSDLQLHKRGHFLHRFNDGPGLQDSTMSDPILLFRDSLSLDRIDLTVPSKRLKLSFLMCERSHGFET